MKLSQLLNNIAIVQEDCELSGLTNDSRAVKSGDCFIAYRGAQYDGRKYIEQAYRQGAAAIIFEETDYFEVPCLPLPLIGINDLTNKIAAIARYFYSNPSQSLNVVGITGTNGKTTIALMLAQAYELLGEKAAYIGTLGVGRPNAIIPGINTTPDAIECQRLMAEFKQQGIKHVVMEVSSHALVQGRVAHIDFDTAIFTNLTHEHLDYHKTMASYAKAKAMLFACQSLKTAVINADDSYAMTMQEAVLPRAEIITYAMKENADFIARNCQLTLDGLEMELLTPQEISKLNCQQVGKFNVYNILAVFAVLSKSHFTPDKVREVISQLPNISGRMQKVSDKPHVFIDYAHTPDALDNALSTLRDICSSRLICVFGCGGNRDREKRPLMGQIAARIADKIIITNDNPRNEAPEAIIQEIKAGIDSSCDIAIEPDRAKAIVLALREATDEDVILIAGKGHENYQVIGSEKYHFSDEETVKSYLTI